MPRVRYTADGGHYRVGGHGFDPGDERDVDDELAEYLTDLDDFEVADDEVDRDEEPASTEDVDGESGVLPFNPDAHTVSEIEERIADIDEPAALRALRNLEQEQQGRTTAVEAITDRLDELEG